MAYIKKSIVSIDFKIKLPRITNIVTCIALRSPRLGASMNNGLYRLPYRLFLETGKVPLTRRDEVMGTDQIHFY